MTELTYINSEGKEKKTSQFLRNRGSCCKTHCTHCPYGFTLKNKGLTFSDISDDQFSEAQRIIDLNQPHESLGVSLLNSAFGNQKKLKISAQNASHFVFVFIKEQLCGVAKKGLTEIKDIYLDRYFKDQGISKDIVSSFYFKEAE